MCSSAENRMCIELSVEAPRGSERSRDWPPPRGQDGHLSSPLCPWWTRLCIEEFLKFFVALFRQRNTCALCRPCKPARVRTLRTKLGVSRQRLATSSRSHHSPGIAEKVPRAKLQKVSSEDRRTLFLGQAVNQRTVIRSVLDFFATEQSCR